METAGSKKQNTEEPREEVECQTPTQPSTSSAKTQAMGEKTNKQSQRKITVVSQRRNHKMLRL